MVTVVPSVAIYEGDQTVFPTYTFKVGATPYNFVVVRFDYSWE